MLFFKQQRIVYTKEPVSMLPEVTWLYVSWVIYVHLSFILVSRVGGNTWVQGIANKNSSKKVFNGLPGASIFR